MAAEQKDFEPVSAGATDAVLGGAGKIGDVLNALIITVNTAATAAVSVKDGAGSAIPILPNSPGGGVGVYTVLFGSEGMRSKAGGWSVTTGAGASALGVGRFQTT